MNNAEAFEECGAKAREFARCYQPGTDGRNTFILLAEWAEGRAKEAQSIDPSTCGTKAEGRSEPSPSNPPPEGKVASQREVARYIVTVGSDAANENNRRLHVNGSQWAKVYGWDRQSVETRAELLAEGLRSLDALASPTDQSSDVSGLVEALRPFAEAAGDLEPSDPDGMNLWEHPIAITLEAGHLRAALSALSQAQQVKP